MFSPFPSFGARMIACILIAISACSMVHSQTLRLLTSGTKTSLRGLSAVNDRVVWVSGSSGMAGRSTDGGATWQWTTINGFEKREFRDIEAFDDSTAIILTVAEPGNILKTTDGGQHWKTVFTDSSRGMFLDAMDFSGRNYGVAVGDPLDSLQPKAYCIYTDNGGESWRPAPFNLPLQKGEAMFASSGTNVVLRKKDLYLATGGTASHIFTPRGKKLLPLLQGKESTGANSLALWNDRQFIVVGGDFLHDKDTVQNCALTKNGGKSWIDPPTPPHGYRSCVTYIDANRLVACGTSGVDISTDGGMHWRLISTEGFHVCQSAGNGHTVFLAGGGGRVARLEW